MVSFSSKGDVSFAQLGLVMDGSCEEDILGVRGVFCDREYKAVWPCPENVSCFVQSNRKRGRPPHCSLGLAHVQLWLLLTKPLLVLAEILPP